MLLFLQAMKYLSTVRIGVLAAVVLSLASCNLFQKVKEGTKELFGEEVVARVGEHKLYRSRLQQFIPAGATAEDSLSLAQRYIQTWAEDLIVLDVAEKQLSKKEMDVSRELEQYRRSLIKYRYEQLYINQRLDTLVTEEQIRRYYESHPDKFILPRPILKTRFVVISPDSPNFKNIRTKMASDKVEDVLEADSLAFSSAIRYADNSDTWLDALTLAKEFGTDWMSMLSLLKNSFIELTDPSGNLRIAYVVASVKEGKTAPLDFCREKVREIIINARKHALAESLEQDLLEEARSDGKFIVY